MCLGVPLPRHDPRYNPADNANEWWPEGLTEKVMTHGIRPRPPVSAYFERIPAPFLKRLKESGALAYGCNPFFLWPIDKEGEETKWVCQIGCVNKKGNKPEACHEHFV